ncbi:MAG TPA: hypothetical protein VL985_18170 [Stellaceae bacterium]|nr:hypothetical protein [Stellaceae bacterium]
MTSWLGVNGCGEAGAVAGFSADRQRDPRSARPFGVTDLAAPATSANIWRHITSRRR